MTAVIVLILRETVLFNILATLTSYHCKKELNVQKKCIFDFFYNKKQARCPSWICLRLIPFLIGEFDLVKKWKKNMAWCTTAAEVGSWTLDLNNLFYALRKLGLGPKEHKAASFFFTYALPHVCTNNQKLENWANQIIVI